MDRRSFLKSMGLGGMSLLMPRPLEVVAARMADVSGPPVHAGLCRFRGVDGFTFMDVGIVLNSWHVKDFLTPEQGADLLDNWTCHVAARWRGGAYDTISVRPMRGVVFCLGDHVASTKPEFNLRGAESVDVWVVPRNAPRHALPPLTVAMYGPDRSTWTRPMPREYMSLPLRAVRLERGRAIELGLASPADPFEAI